MMRNFSALLLGAVLVLLPGPSVHSKSNELRFQDLTIADGLSSNTVGCIIQDSHGFMWFGTPNGLNKYDGYGVKVYRNEPGEPNLISCSDILSLCEDRNGDIWVGTKSCGVYVYDREKDRVRRFPLDQDSTGQFNTYNVRVICEDREGRVWIGTENSLYCFRRETGETIRYQHLETDSTGLSHSTIYSVLQDRKNRLWVGTYNGLNLFDEETGRFRRYFHDPGRRDDNILNIHEDEDGNLWMGVYNEGVIRFHPDEGAYERYAYDKNGANTLSSNNVFSLTGDGQGHLYLGTENGGLNVLDLKTGKFSYYTFKLEEAGGITSNSIYSLYYSRDGMLWVGTFNGGINYASKLNQGFRHYKASKGGLNNPHILSLTENKDGNLWIGTDGGGLNFWNRKTGVYTHYRHDENLPHSLGANEVATIFEDRAGDVWVGLYQAGLDLFEPETGRFAHFRHDPGNRHTIQNNNVNVILEGSRGQFYLGTEAGLDCFDRRTKKFERFPHNIIETGILAILEDRRGNLWVGTYGGLSFVDLTADTVKNYLYVDESMEVVRTVTALCEDSKDHLWVGTVEGLFLLDRTSQQFLRYPRSEKNLSGEIASIVEDGQGNLWISNHHSLLKLEEAIHLPEHPAVVNYGIYGGIRKLYQSREGEIFFGGNHGLNAFFPQDIMKNDHVPPVVITNFMIFGKEVGIDAPGSPLRRHISETQDLSLAHDQSVITFEFAALNYVSPKKNQYAYFLEGFDKEWNYSGNQRAVTYTNLDPGDYVFRVKGANNDGVWNNTGVAVRIKIIPPWWKTSWAYAAALLLAALLLYSVWQFQLNRARMQHELAMEHLHAEKLEEVNRMKSRFFTNITHEFRTPLTLIIGQVKQMLNETPGPAKSRFQMILRNSQKLYQLINQLLDLSKLEAGFMPLRARKLNVVALLRDMVMLFVPLAERRQITLQFSTQGDSNQQLDFIEAYIDQDKFEKIISNLLSNAIKFTPECGTITVHVAKESHDHVEIKVKDNGPGFPVEYVDRVFDRFYQVDDSNTRNHGGSGIGLALTKELVDLHHGTIGVETGNSGTTLAVRLPLSKSHFADDEIVAETPVAENTDAAQISWYDQLSGNHDPGEQPETSKPPRKAPLILIVEDNNDLRRYLRQNLSHDYYLIEARDGREGLDQALARIPDLIVSDVMMPGMDGFELCAKIKQDERTSHIPVILLTARSTGESKIEGLEAGADDYIIKPFEMKELLVRMKNLIEQRRQLRMRFNRLGGLQPEEIATTSLDQRLLKKALAIIEENMSDPEFGVATFASKIAMSRVQLHRKIRALTGQSTSEFIRVVRLNRAAQLLKQQHDSITQIAYLVGFNSSSYFSRSFYKHFGIAPSDYANNGHS